MSKVTLHNVQALKRGNSLHIPREKQACERWRVSGQVKLWKTDPNRVRVPLKFGLYSYDAITELDFNSDGTPANTHLKSAVIVKPGMPCPFCGSEY